MFSSCLCALRKKGERLDWMYSAAAGQVDHEMYLLGKPVDKAVDPMAQENEEVGLNSLKCHWNEIFVSFFIHQIYSFKHAYNHGELYFGQILMESGGLSCRNRLFGAKCIRALVPSLRTL